MKGTHGLGTGAAAIAHHKLCCQSVLSVACWLEDRRLIVQGPKRDPYLWLHLVGLAALPLCAELCLLGLAAGDPLLPGGWDWLLVGLLGTGPIAAMQWLRPFYPFSIALVSLRADSLDQTQQRILQRWASWEPKAIALISTVLVLWGLQWLDRLSPVAAEIAPLDNRSLGLLVAWLGALLGSGLLAIAAAALWVLLTPTAAFEAIEPFPLGNVPAVFLRPSLRLTRLLSPLAESDSREVGMKTQSEADTEAEAEEDLITLDEPPAEPATAHEPAPIAQADHELDNSTEGAIANPEPVAEESEESVTDHESPASDRANEIADTIDTDQIPDPGDDIAALAEGSSAVDESSTETADDSSDSSVNRIKF
ncbi:MAG: low-complexity tail membrane protein [Oscillatoriales cyanobacterium]|nr:MAG: low-complexity tail membrane protein [Oscillatoriales cyanobacterium]